MSNSGYIFGKRIALRVIKNVVGFRYGPEAYGWWLWEETPFPFGPPYWYQIHAGIRWAFRWPRSWKTFNREYNEAK